MECGVCYTEVSEQERSSKPCCPNILCRSCLARLVDPRCPFCRGLLRGVVMLAFSIPNETSVWPVVASDILWMDDTEFEMPSRIRRRRDRRRRQLQERERDRVMNQQLSRVLRESRAEARRVITRGIHEDAEIFCMDQNEGRT